ncbi:GNAT family N-acetyltransferase [Stomatohabitans albus]|uniref:GNAT family N-acetyltransferase n=1 Tax=Stomatohabitans albus TaxID=3110766 RepID=UPI00300DBCA5
MINVVGVDDINRQAVLQAIRADFGQLTGPAGFDLPWEPNGDASAARDDDGLRHIGLAAPPRLHVLAELIANAATHRTTTQFSAAIGDGGQVEGVMAYIPHSLVLMAGHESCAERFAKLMHRASWRVVMGDESLTYEALDRWRRRSWWVPAFRTRRQCFMVSTGPPLVVPGSDANYRVAMAQDVEDIVHLSAVLHVDDQMGPPLSAGAMDTLRIRVAETIAQGRTWVMDEGGRAVAKFDIHNLSLTYGAQLSGVVVHEDYRGRGLGTRLVANAIADLLRVGVPQITLHLREGNAVAVRAYEKAGMHKAGHQLMAIM